MKLAIYGDAHVTRKMGFIQGHWDTSVISIFKKLYEDFNKAGIDGAICLGDFFDKSVLEAKSVKLVTEILSIMENSKFPTSILLGNHEIDSNDHNILDFLQGYSNVIPITELTTEDRLTFIPYSVSLEEVSKEHISDKFVFTHHDIYGSELAGGKVKASFGTHPETLSSATAVFNGHVHLPSSLGNIHNIGSITKMQQGEIRIGELPQYILLDTSSNNFERVFVEDNLILPITVRSTDIDSVLSLYKDSNKFLLRVIYDGETPNLKDYKKDSRILSISLRKSIGDSVGDNTIEIKKSNLDIKEFLSTYVNSDSSLDENMKSKIIPLGISLLGE